MKKLTEDQATALVGMRDELDKTIATTVSSFIVEATKLGLEGCQMFDLAAEVMGFRLGQLISLHGDYDFRVSNEPATGELSLKKLLSAIKDVEYDVACGFEHGNKTLGHPSISKPLSDLLKSSALHENRGIPQIPSPETETETETSDAAKLLAKKTGAKDPTYH